MSRITGDQTFVDAATFLGTVTMVGGQITNTSIKASADILASKLEHQFPVRYSQASNETAHDHSEVVHDVYGVTGAILSVNAGSIVACTGSAEIDIDVLVGGSSILTGAITLDSANVAYTPEAGVVDTEALAAGNAVEISVKARGLDAGDLVYNYDFLADAGDTLPDIWGTDEVSAAGAPTLDYVTDSSSGIYRLATDATDELQALQLFSSDNLWIDLLENPIVEWRAKMTLSGASLMSANERLVMGVCSNHTNAEDALDSVTNNAWFRMEGASANILVEADDGTTDTDDQDSTVDHVDAAWMHFKIDFSSLSDVKFYINGTEQGGAAVSMAAITTTTLVQPIFCIQRDLAAADEIEIMDIDNFKVTSGRTGGTLGKGVYCTVMLTEKAA